MVILTYQYLSEKRKKILSEILVNLSLPSFGSKSELVHRIIQLVKFLPELNLNINHVSNNIYEENFEPVNNEMTSRKTDKRERTLPFANGSNEPFDISFDISNQIRFHLQCYPIFFSYLTGIHHLSYFLDISQNPSTSQRLLILKPYPQFPSKMVKDDNDYNLVDWLYHLSVFSLSPIDIFWLDDFNSNYQKSDTEKKYDLYFDDSLIELYEFLETLSENTSDTVLVSKIKCYHISSCLPVKKFNVISNDDTDGGNNNLNIFLCWKEDWRQNFSVESMIKPYQEDIFYYFCGLSSNISTNQSGQTWTQKIFQEVYGLNFCEKWEQYCKYRLGYIQRFQYYINNINNFSTDYFLTTLWKVYNQYYQLTSDFMNILFYLHIDLDFILRYLSSPSDTTHRYTVVIVSDSRSLLYESIFRNYYDVLPTQSRHIVPSVIFHTTDLCFNQTTSKQCDNKLEFDPPFNFFEE